MQNAQAQRDFDGEIVLPGVNRHLNSDFVGMVDDVMISVSDGSAGREMIKDWYSVDRDHAVDIVIPRDVSVAVEGKEGRVSDLDDIGRLDYSVPMEFAVEPATLEKAERRALYFSSIDTSGGRSDLPGGRPLYMYLVEGFNKDDAAGTVCVRVGDQVWEIEGAAERVVGERKDGRCVFAVASDDVFGYSIVDGTSPKAERVHGVVVGDDLVTMVGYYDGPLKDEYLDPDSLKAERLSLSLGNLVDDIPTFDTYDDEIKSDGFVEDAIALKTYSDVSSFDKYLQDNFNISLDSSLKESLGVGKIPDEFIKNLTDKAYHIRFDSSEVDKLAYVNQDDVMAALKENDIAADAVKNSQDIYNDKDKFNSFLSDNFA